MRAQRTAQPRLVERGGGSLDDCNFMCACYPGGGARYVRLEVVMSFIQRLPDSVEIRMHTVGAAWGYIVFRARGSGQEEKY